MNPNTPEGRFLVKLMSMTQGLRDLEAKLGGPQLEDTSPQFQDSTLRNRFYMALRRRTGPGDFGPGEKPCAAGSDNGSRAPGGRSAAKPRAPEPPPRRKPLAGQFIDRLKGVGRHIIDARLRGPVEAQGETSSAAGRPEDHPRIETAALVSATCCLPGPGALVADEPQLPSTYDDFWGSLLSAPEPEVVGDRYVLVGALWAGGMSRVFRGFDREAGRFVAVKIIPPGVSAVQRRSLEAILALDHENILRVEDYGEAGDGGLYLVMRLLEGPSLRALLFARNEAVEALLAAFRKVCQGIGHAHSHGIIHRDLKPANIQLEPDGQTTIIDWGLACRWDQPPALDEGILGTPLYMAPEQIEGKPLSPRTDVYSLGTVLYEILTGVNPVGPAGDLSSILGRVQNQTPPPPSHVRRDVSSHLDGIVMRCLRKSPSERFADASELLEELEGCAWNETAWPESSDTV